jgi:hypothetical protein
MGFLRKLFGKTSDPPNQSQYAKMFMDGIRRAGETRKIVYDSDQFRILPEEQSSRCMFLGNVYAEYCSVPREEREATLKRAVRNWFVAEKETPEDFEDARHDLLPVIRTRGYLGSYFLLMEVEGNAPEPMPSHLVGDDMAVTLVYDLPEAMRSIVQTDLDRWGITFYEALEVARDNLRHLPHSFIGPKEGEGVYLSATHDNYDSSRLLLLDTIRQFQVKGDFVAMIPNRDTLIVTGADDEEGLKGMLALAKDALQQPRPMSGLALRLDGDEWVSWLPDVAHPLYGEFRLLEVQSVMEEYSEQKRLLDKLHEKKQQDIFVASYKAMANQTTGQITTYCVWGKDVLALLPHTNRIMFVQDGKEPLAADWDRVVEEMGDSMKPMDIYPERFQVVGFPTEEQLAAMGASKP